MPNSPAMAMMAMNKPHTDARRGPSRLPPIPMYPRKACLCRPPAAAPTVGGRDAGPRPTFRRHCGRLDG